MVLPVSSVNWFMKLRRVITWHLYVFATAQIQSSLCRYHWCVNKDWLGWTTEEKNGSWIRNQQTWISPQSPLSGLWEAPGNVSSKQCSSFPLQQQLPMWLSIIGPIAYDPILQTLGISDFQLKEDGLLYSKVESGSYQWPYFPPHRSSRFIEGK